MSFIDGYLIEINQFPRYSEPGNGKTEWFTIKDYFLYDSNTLEFGHRDTIVPVSEILNKEEIPDLETIRSIINSKSHVIGRSMNFEEHKQSWFYDSSKIGETK
jgi:hypothetical protein